MTVQKQRHWSIVGAVAQRVISPRIRTLVAFMGVMLLASACSGQSSAYQEPPAGTSDPVSEQGASASERSANVSEEQLEVLLQDVAFPLRQWPRTNFRIHSIPLGEFRGGGPPKDGIRSLDKPKFETVTEADRWLEDREPVQVVEIRGDARAYPQQIMIWHEIVNDTVGGEPVTITF